MLKKVTITNYLGNSVEYIFQGASIDDQSGLLITEIEGLGPPKADINMTKLATSDGGIYNSGRIDMRNIVIKGIFTYATTIEEARLMSYKFFPIGKQITFQIETDKRIGYVSGYVESNEPDIFSDLEEMQVSVLCEDPFFTDKNGETEQVFSNIEPLFEFVYENQGHNPVTEMGQYIKYRQNIVVYNGDSEAGCVFDFHAIGEVRNVTFYNTRTNEQIYIDTDKLRQKTGAGFGAGDSIIVTTIRGKKSVYLLRDGVYTNILNIMSKNTSWPQLAKGENIFQYTCDYGEENLYIYIRVTARYEGV